MFSRSLMSLALLGCSLSIGAAEEPKWLKEARARESKPGAMTSMKSEDGFFSAAVPAKVLGKIEQQNEGYTATIDIGSETPMTCEVLKGGFDLASTLRNVAAVTFRDLEPIQGKVDAKGIEAQDAGVIGASPFMTVDWIYRVNDGKAARLGALKQFAASKGGQGIYCAHVDLGYVQTFRRVASAFLESTGFENAVVLPDYFEVSTASFGDRRVGIAITSLTKQQDGELELVNSTSLLYPVAADAVNSQDSYHVQWARADASLIEATHVVSANGELETKLSLTSTAEGGWSVAGQFKQKEINEKIDKDSIPVTWLAQAKARQALATQSDIVGKTLVDRVWVVASPTALIESTFTVTSTNDGKVVGRETAGPLSMDVVLDNATGLPTSAVMHLGPQTITLERVYRTGTL